MSNALQKYIKHVLQDAKQNALPLQEATDAGARSVFALYKSKFALYFDRFTITNHNNMLILWASNRTDSGTNNYYKERLSIIHTYLNANMQVHIGYDKIYLSITKIEMALKLANTPDEFEELAKKMYKR